jgi:L-asparaginase II
MGVDHHGYVRPEHPVQRAVKATIESLTGAGLAEDRCAVDGCSVPTWAIPLADLALAFARFGTGRALAPERAKAAARLRAACAAHPWHVAGSGRFCTDVMQRFGARVFVKTGAEGVYCAALPDEGLGLAVKCDDGATRAAEVMTAALIARFLKSNDGAIERFVRPTLHNWNGIAVGQLRPTDLLLPKRP